MNAVDELQRADTRPGPMAGTERYFGLDALRGVAVLGILVMNIYAFAMPFIAYANPLAMGGREVWNLGTWFVTHIFFDMKFISIFSMLYGAGIVLMGARAEARGAAFAPIFYRRSFWLMILGAGHAYLIWFGDILFFYAVVGMIIYLFRRRGPVMLISAACILLLIGVLFTYSGGVYMEDLKARAEALGERQAQGETLDEQDQASIDEWQEARTFMLPGPEQLDEDMRAYTGDYTGIVRHRASFVVTFQLQGLPFFIFWRVGSLMLIGMALMKLSVLNGHRSAGFYRNLMIAGYGFGLPLTIFSAINANAHGFDPLYMFRIGNVWNYFGSIPVALGHVGLVMVLVRRGYFRGLLERFAAVGQMALTNYLMHSVVMTTLFYGYGLGLYGQIPRFWQMAFVAGMIGLQLWVSPLWLRRFRFGPVEWLWRTLTYARRQPMVRPA